MHFIHYSLSPGPLSSLSSHLYSRARSFTRAGALVPFIFVLGNIRPRYLLDHQTFKIHRLDCIGLGEFGVRRGVDYDGVRKERLFSWGASFEALFTGGQHIPVPPKTLFHIVSVTEFWDIPCAHYSSCSWYPVHWTINLWRTSNTLALFYHPDAWPIVLFPISHKAAECTGWDRDTTN